MLLTKKKKSMNNSTFLYQFLDMRHVTVCACVCPGAFVIRYSIDQRKSGPKDIAA